MKSIIHKYLLQLSDFGKRVWFALQNIEVPEPEQNKEE